MDVLLTGFTDPETWTETELRRWLRAVSTDLFWVWRVMGMIANRVPSEKARA